MLLFSYCYAVHRDLHSFPTRRSSDLSHRVENITRDGGEFRLTTERGEIRANRVALAAGNANMHLAPMVGLECPIDRKSTRLNSSHGYISYAVFCLKKKTANLQFPISG